MTRNRKIVGLVCDSLLDDRTNIEQATNGPIEYRTKNEHFPFFEVICVQLFELLNS
jgi:hypothetical protein